MKCPEFIYISLPEEIFQRWKDVSSVQPPQLLPLESSFAQKPWNTEVLIASLLQFLVCHQDDTSLEAYRSLLFLLNPELEEHLKQRYLALQQDKVYSEAAEVMAALSALVPKSLSYLFNCASAYRSLMQHFDRRGEGSLALEAEDDVYRIYRHIEQNFPKDIDSTLYFSMADFYIDRHDWKQARRCLERYLEKEDSDLRRSKVDEVLHMVVRQEQGQNILSSVYDLVNLQREEKALQLIETFLEENPSSPEGHFLQAWVYRRLKRYSEALEILEKLDDVPGLAFSVHNEQAINYFEQSSYLEAQQAWQKALDEDSENPEVLLNLGTVAYKLANFDQSRHYYQKLLSLQPENSLAKRGLSLLDHQENNHHSFSSDDP